MLYQNILVRATNWVGDAVMSLPALRALRERYPKAHIAILAKPWVIDLYRREPVADELIPYTANHVAAKWHTGRSLRERRFDCAVLLQNAFEAAALAWIARIPERIGYARDGRAALLTRPIPVPKSGEIPRHERFYYLELLRRAEIIEQIPACDTVVLAGAEEARARGIHRFRELGLGDSVIGISPGAAFGTAKRWLPERFAEAANVLASGADPRVRGRPPGRPGRDEGVPRGPGGPPHHAGVAVFGSKAERELCGSVAALIQAPVANLAGETTLAEFIDLAAACRVYLTNDSGAMHIASALGVPTVAVFGATDESATGPAGPLARIVREPVECSPCLKRECPIDHRCMTRVEPARVAQAALELMK